jgi:WD40 repeat protein
MKDTVRRNGYITMHRGQVICVAIHLAIHIKGDNLVASAGKDKIKLTNMDTGIVRRTWIHRDDAMSLSFSPDGKCLAAGFTSGAVTIIHVEGGEEKCFQQGHARGVKSVTFSPDGKGARTAQ